MHVIDIKICPLTICPPWQDKKKAWRVIVIAAAVAVAQCAVSTNEFGFSEKDDS
jgi:hypothetical protein